MRYWEIEDIEARLASQERMVEDMAIDLTALQAANDALDESENAVASDLQSLTDLVDKLQKNAADNGDAASQAAINSIAVHVNAVVTRMAADVAGHQPPMPPNATAPPNPSPVTAVPPAPEQPPTDPTADPNPAPGAGGVVPVEPSPADSPPSSSPGDSAASAPADTSPADPSPTSDQSGARGNTDPVVTPDPSAPPVTGTPVDTTTGSAQTGPTDVTDNTNPSPDAGPVTPAPVDNSTPTP